MKLDAVPINTTGNMMFPFVGPGNMNFFLARKNPENGGWKKSTSLWQCRDYIGDFLAYVPVEEEEASKSIDTDAFRCCIFFNNMNGKAVSYAESKERFLSNLDLFHKSVKDMHPDGKDTVFYEPVFGSNKAHKDTASGALLMEADPFWQSTCAANSVFMLLTRVLQYADNNRSWLNIKPKRADDAMYLEKLKSMNFSEVFPYLRSLNGLKYRHGLADRDSYGHGAGGIVNVFSDIEMRWVFRDHPDREYLVDTNYQISQGVWEQLMSSGQNPFEK